MLSKTEKIQIPKVGMLAIIRRRRGVINEVREFDGESGDYMSIICPNPADTTLANIGITLRGTKS